MININYMGNVTGPVNDLVKTKNDNNVIKHDFGKILKIQKTNLSKTETTQSLNPNIKEDGTDLAIKKLAKEMEVQIISMFFNMMDNARDAKPEGGFGEEMFRGKYLTEIVKSSSDDQLGELGLAIYDNLSNNKNIKGK